MTITEFSWGKPGDQSLFGMNGEKLKLSDDVLITNIRWFITFRWILIAILVFFEILMLSASDILAKVGITEQQKWPIAIIIVLIIANIAYLFALYYCKSGKYNSPTINLWAQIIVDLICLSVVVHYIGSTSTPISFFYVLHIALACIFFSTRESLYVTILVCVMDAIVIAIDNFLINQAPLSALVKGDYILSESARRDGAIIWMLFLDILFLVVWYVVSRLSLIVRNHERHLSHAYKQIKQAQVEKDQYALLITHQLKSPLDAIRSKINLIKEGYLGEMTPEISEALDQMDFRAKNMSGLILDLLRLERLKTNCLDTAKSESIAIKTVLKKCIDKLTPLINTKKISLHVSVENFSCQCIPDQLEILFENIISNAITYSHEGTSVEIISEIISNHQANIIITDHGIGIESKELPNIFNEYFYSPRAALHNKATSGIGLSIVKIAAENNKLKIKVASEPGVGTSFTVVFDNIQLLKE